MSDRFVVRFLWLFPQNTAPQTDVEMSLGMTGNGVGMIVQF